MRFPYILNAMIELFRSLQVVFEEGSLNQAALRMRVSQPSITRRMQLLESELDGPLLERRSSGVQPTALGQAVMVSMGPILEKYDAALADLRRNARGQNEVLRIGYIGSAAHKYLNPALGALRGRHPEAKVKLMDLTPAEQVVALNKGEIDLALIGQEGSILSRDFYTRKLAILGVCVALPSDHYLATKRELQPADLKREVFIGTPESAVPGRNRWVTQICHKGGFRPKFIAEADSIEESFMLVVSEGAVMLLPDYFTRVAPPGTVMIPLTDKCATWDLLLVWQRGRASVVLKSMVDLLAQAAR